MGEYLQWGEKPQYWIWVIPTGGESFNDGSGYLQWGQNLY